VSEVCEIIYQAARFKLDISQNCFVCVLFKG